MIKKLLPITSFLLGIALFNFNFIAIGIIIFSFVCLLNFEKSYVPFKHFLFLSLPVIVILITSLALGHLDSKWIEKRAAFVIFPFLFFYCMKHRNFYIIKNNIFKGFVWGGFLTSLLLIVIASYKSIINKGFTFYNDEISHLAYNNYFLHKSLSQPVKIHPSYLSIYLLFAILMIYNKEVIFKSEKIKKIIFGILIFLIILLQAKIIIPIIIVFAIITLKKNKKVLYYIIPIVLVVMIVNKRFIISNFNPPNKVTKSLYLSKGWNAINIRLELNKVGLDLAKKVDTKEFLFGVSPKKLKNKLRQNYKNNNLMYFFKKKLDLHNQYISEFLEGGIIALIGILTFMFYTLKSSIKLKNITFMLLSITIIIYSFLEEFMTLQSGIIFISLFSSIYIKQLYLETQKKPI